MKLAWVEELLGLLPAASFIVALHFEPKRPMDRFPFRFARIYNFAFLTCSTALVAMGLYLVYDSSMKLIQIERPTIEAAPLVGTYLWMGWVMVVVLPNWSCRP